MDSRQETEIIKYIQAFVDENGECEVGMAAKEIVHYVVSDAEKENLVRKITRSEAFLSERRGKDRIILKNPQFKPSLLYVDTGKKLKLVKFFVSIVVSILISVVIRLLVPSDKEIQLPPKRQDLLADTSFHWHWSNSSDSLTGKTK